MGNILIIAGVILIIAAVAFLAYDKARPLQYIPPAEDEILKLTGDNATQEKTDGEDLMIPDDDITLKKPYDDDTQNDPSSKALQVSVDDEALKMLDSDLTVKKPYDDTSLPQ